MPRPDVAPESKSKSKFAPIPGKPLRLITWGGLVPGKGLHLLVEACERLATPVELHHYGRALDADYRERVQASARRTCLVLHGEYGQSTICREFPCHDLAVFPSLFHETYGFAVDEAMLLGLPVVVSDSGAPCERIGDRGIAFCSGSADDLAEKLEQLVKDPARLAAMREVTPPTGQTLTEHVRIMDDVYRGALQGADTV